ncbi:MAG: D-aminoacyl-tRNA deacylase [Acidobacteriota bacterium]
MKVLVQRVKSALVRVSGECVARIGKGLLIFIGVEQQDTSKDALYFADKVASFRIFEDENGKMNLAIKEVDGEILVVSQFTLAAKTRKGNRPSFDGAAPPDKARLLYEIFIDRLRESGINVASGRFQEKMEVELINDGPVTFLIDPK